MEDELIMKIRKKTGDNIKATNLYVKERVEKLSDLLADNPKVEETIDKGWIKQITDLEAQLSDAFRKVMGMHEMEQIFEAGRAFGRLEAVELISGLTLKKRKK